ncbi:cullin-like protein 3 [Hibiscus syriacus]|uniref:cullin-like protein 3 n=1 Tax=Hibiscus syriacus TaxID=106335 RepID=UPI0019248B42|nr:cullin-like protein 3 [Hibiscus syriacus]
MKLPNLQESALLTFYNLIDREREGEGIDQDLVKYIVSIYVDVGQGSMKYYERGFEEAMFEATAAFYSTKAPSWIKNESYNDYMLKV